MQIHPVPPALWSSDLKVGRCASRGRWRDAVGPKVLLPLRVSCVRASKQMQGSQEDASVLSNAHSQGGSGNTHWKLNGQTNALHGAPDVRQANILLPLAKKLKARWPCKHQSISLSNPPSFRKQATLWETFLNFCSYWKAFFVLSPESLLKPLWHHLMSPPWCGIN